MSYCGLPNPPPSPQHAVNGGVQGQQQHEGGGHFRQPQQQPHQQALHDQHQQDQFPIHNYYMYLQQHQQQQQSHQHHQGPFKFDVSTIVYKFRQRPSFSFLAYSFWDYFPYNLVGVIHESPPRTTFPTAGITATASTG